MIASKFDSVEVVKFLIIIGLNLNKKDGFGETAADFAWASNSLKSLILLLNADSPFPKKFDVSLLECSEDKLNIIDIADKMRDFHKSILDENSTKIKSFLTAHSDFRFAYDEKNQCALTTALISKNIQIYSLIRNKFFEAGIDSENHNSHLEALSGNMKEEIRKEIRSHLGKPVVMALLSRSRDLSGNKDNFKKIIDLYEALNDIPEIRPVLRLVAKSEDTDIFFDFNEKGVFNLDPTVDNKAFGVTYNSGHILIGAGRRKNEVLATIAHELTHWAVQLTYKNKCQPFNIINDETRREMFEGLVKQYRTCRKTLKNYSEIAEIYDKYTPDQWNKEMIVLVPQTLAFYKNNIRKLENYKRDLKDLFNYFEEHVLRDVEKELCILEVRKEVREANNNFGVLKRFQESKTLSTNCKKSVNLDKSIFINTLTPELVLENIIRQIQEISPKGINTENIFVDLKQVIDSKTSKNLISAVNLGVHLRIFILGLKKSSQPRVMSENLLKALCKVTTIFISSFKSACFDVFIESEVEINFEWNNLNDRTKSKILETKIIFQDFEIALSEIITTESLLFQKLPLHEILKALNTKLGNSNSSLPEKPRYFIKRKYTSISKSESKHAAEKNDESNELCSMLLNHKTILISDSAGTGKSTSAAQLARDLKLLKRISWVVFIDLKEHTKTLARDEQCIDRFFFSADILKLNSRFEEKLFGEFYENKKVIFIIDGFDEISPNYKEVVIKIMKTIKKSENYLLVTTRPHYVEELGKELNPKIVKMMEFSGNDQIDFLNYYWQKKSDNSDFKLKIEDFLDKLKESSESSDFFSCPIHIHMLAECLLDTDWSKLENFKLNRYSLYRSFLGKQLEIWIQKGPLAIGDNAIIQLSSTNLSQKFQRIAFEQVFNAKEILNLKLPKISEKINDEMIARVGIVAFGLSRSLEFSHRTFAEYFISDYIFNETFIKNSQSSQLFIVSMIRKDFVQMRYFLNDRLQIGDEKFETKTLAKHVKKFLIGDKKIGACCQHIFFQNNMRDTNFLHHIVKEKQLSLLAFVLQTLKFDSNLKLKLVKEVLHEAVGCLKVFKALWGCVESFVGSESFGDVQKSLLFSKNQKNDSILSYVVALEKSDADKVTQCILDIAKETLNEREFLKLLLDEDSFEFPFRSALEHEQKFSKIWEASTDVLGPESVEKLLIGRNKAGKTCLHLNIPNDCKAFQNYLHLLRKRLETDKLNEFLKTKDSNNQLFTYYVLENITVELFKDIWKLIEEKADEATRREFLLSEDKNEHILVEASVSNKINKAQLIDYIFDITEAMLQSEGKDIITFLRKRSFLNDVILNSAVSSESLFKKFSKKLDQDELRKVLLSDTKKGENVLHFLVLNDNQDEAIKMWNLIVKKIFYTEEVTRLLFGEFTWMTRNNAFHYAAKKKDRMFITILNWCEVNFDLANLKKIFTERDENLWTVFHLLAEYGSESSVVKCFEVVQEKFSREERQEIFLLKNIGRRIPLQETCSNTTERILKLFWTAYLEAFDYKLLKTFLNKETFAFLRSGSQYYDTVKKLLTQSKLD